MIIHCLCLQALQQGTNPSGSIWNWNGTGRRGNSDQGTNYTHSIKLHVMDNYIMHAAVMH